ncbi:MAG: DoxX family protein [bacterium]
MDTSRLCLSYPPLFWAVCAALAEFVGGIFVLLGFNIRWASAFVGFVMVVAILGVHVPKALGDPKIGLFGEIEFQLSLLAMSISLILTGPGRYSIKIEK